MSTSPRIIELDAVTLAVTDMAASVAFYDALGFDTLEFGGADAEFTTYEAGGTHLNLQLVDEPPEVRWGRPIFHVTDVDAIYERAIEAGLVAEFAPRDAVWCERYFHIRDPDGHEISFATPLTNC